MFKGAIVWFAIINIIGSAVNIADKAKAKRGKWRIKERTLWAIALLGGAPGSYLTMKLIRHKTQHSSFMAGFPVLSIIQMALLCYLYYKTNGGI